MEGKEVRFGIARLCAVRRHHHGGFSCGAVNAMHDSFTPLGGARAAWLLIQLGEVVFGGVGSGLYGMLVFALLAVFIAGLMIGRTPEYLGKKIEAPEMKLVSLAILVVPLLVLGHRAGGDDAEPAAPGCSTRAHTASRRSCTPVLGRQQQRQRLCRPERQHALLQPAAGVAMWFGRFGVIVPVLALAGSLANKKRLAVPVPARCPRMARSSCVLLIGTVLLVGLLNYVPALALGPVVEHLLLWPTEPKCHAQDP
jgi:K+-transporting ATPase ATPase A chain